MKKKKVILLVPNLFGIEKCFEKNLNYCGYEIINLSYLNDVGRYYPNLFSRLKEKYLKLFHYKQFKDYRKYLHYVGFSQQNILTKLGQLKDEKADYALIVRADLFPMELIHLIKNKCNQIINYQWDGLNSTPDIWDYIPLFDKFFVFDDNDILANPKLNLKKTSNFYFDYPLDDKLYINDQIISAYFLGANEKSRMNSILLFVEKAKELGIKLNFIIVGKEEYREYFNQFSDIKFLPYAVGVNFEHNLYNVQANSIIVDFLNPHHQGLSFRVFESLRFNKKLITTNPTIRNYDFYHPDNILIWDGNNLSGLAEFLNRPYNHFFDDMKTKYSFSYWCNSIFN